MDQGAESYRRFLAGDRSGLEELVSLYNRRLIFFLNGFVHNAAAAEDLAADTFLELLVCKNRFVEDAPFQTWLFRVARNNAVDYLRKEKRRLTRPLETLENVCAYDEELGAGLLLDERKKNLSAAMERLPLDYREVLHLLYFEEMSYKAAGTVLRKTEKQIKNLAYRARQALKTTLEKEGFLYEDG